ncbi:hypothetical protein [Demequina rhizosphaerae]|uniref:hypothetical protein n=1 Tax=Demequina rhizosphaerae TaxID=1638985 RepID=UPI0007844716|nr:hypothetical protein [Demequina rhizosphaerae]
MIATGPSDDAPDPAAHADGTFASASQSSAGERPVQVGDVVEQVALAGGDVRHLTPLRACKEYADGARSRDEVIDFLVSYAYAPGGHTDGWDSLVVDPPGAWSEVETALRHGLIDEHLVDEVCSRRDSGAR